MSGMRVWTVVFVEAAVLAELAALSVVSVVVVLEVLAESAVSAVVLVAVGASAEVSAVVLASAEVSAVVLVAAVVSAGASAQVSNGGDDLAEGNGVPRPRHGLHSTTLGSRGHIGDCTTHSYIHILGRHIGTQWGIGVHNEVGFATCEQESDGGDGAKKRFVFHDESLSTRIRLY